MTPTEQLRQRVIDHLGGRFDNEKRSLRAFAAESGVGFNTIARFVRGNQITSDVFDRLSAALARDAGSAGAHKPGDHHDYRIECAVCGQRGMVNLSIEPQRYDAERQGES